MKLTDLAQPTVATSNVISQVNFCNFWQNFSLFCLTITEAYLCCLMNPQAGGWMSKWSRASCFALVGALMALLSESALAQSEIVPDETLGDESSQVRTNVNVKGNAAEVIEGGAQRGANLFHSFSEFNVDSGRGAYFANPTGIENILSRVTGTNPSEILGTLGVSGNANLFLINPNGIIFGENARLDVGGSFVGTTADGLEFGDRGFFSATEPDAPPLLTVKPSALFFNQMNAGRIENQSTASAGVNLSGESLSGLRVPDGESLLLVGGDIAIDGGGLNALGGRVELGGLAATGNVGLDVDKNNLSLNFPENLKRADVSLTNGARVNVTAEGGGSISINANNLEISGTSQLLAGIEEGLGSVDSKAGDIAIDATGTINLTGATSTTQRSSITNSVQPGATGQAGNIRIAAGLLSVTEGAELNTSTSGQGNAGNIIINARGAVQFESGQGKGQNFASSRAYSRVERGAEGQGGELEIKAEKLSVTDGALLSVSSRGQGNAGSVNIEARGEVEFDGVGLDNTSSGIYSQASGVEGQGGRIKVTASSLSVTNGARVSTQTFTDSVAGDLTVFASDTVRVRGESANGQPSVLITRTRGEGDAGDLTITTGKLLVQDGAQVNTRSSLSNESKGNAGNLTVTASESVQVIGESFKGQPSILTTRTDSGGDAGALTITTGKLIIQNGAEVSTRTFTDSTGDAGNLSVTALESVKVIGELKQTPDNLNPNSSVLTTRTAGKGSAGNLTIDTGQLIIQNGAAVSAGALVDSTGDAGDLIVTASDSVEVIGRGKNRPSTLTTSTAGEGKAGTLTIDTGQLIIQNGAEVATRTSFSIENTGDAGDLTITTEDLMVTDGAFIRTSTSGSGNGGNIIINARDRVSLDGVGSKDIFPSGVYSRMFNDAKGQTGNITVNVTEGSLYATNGGELNTDTRETGNAGNITINARDTILNEGSITAKTTSNQGGNINLQVQNILNLRNNSQITATAGEGGDGGNINIDTDFIIATPLENSDIVAKALQGNGGNINIDATSIFGIEQRRATPGNETNDIDASSEFGLEGTVEINTPEVDPNRGLVQLPTQPTETEVAQACTPGSSQAQSEFIITGRGGLPPTPTDALSSDAIGVDLVTLNPEEAESQGRQGEQKSISQSPVPDRIVEAEGMVVDENGEVLLIASTPNSSPQNSWQNRAECDGK